MESVHIAVTTLLGFAAVFVLITSIVTGLAATSYSGVDTGGFSIDLFLNSLIAFPVLLVLYLDHVQSAVLASITGIFASGIVSTQYEARVWTAGLFLALQVATYCVAVLALVIGSDLSGALHLRQSLANLVDAVAAVLILYAAREIIIARLWENVIRQTETTEVPLETLVDVVT